MPNNLTGDTQFQKSCDKFGLVENSPWIRNCETCKFFNTDWEACVALRAFLTVENGDSDWEDAYVDSSCVCHRWATYFKTHKHNVLNYVLTSTRRRHYDPT